MAEIKRILYLVYDVNIQNGIPKLITMLTFGLPASSEQCPAWTSSLPNAAKEPGG